MAFCSCTQPLEEFHDEYTVTTIQSHLSDDSDSQASQMLGVDHRRATPLFRNIEQKNWEGVLLFLTSGKWSNSILSSSNLHMKGALPDIQVRTWVTSFQRGNAEWSQLPIHAAIAYRAPQIIIERLLVLYPKGARCKDSEGMLPLHLAFSFGSGEGVIDTLLEVFPGAINERGAGGRYPYQCCELPVGPNRIRGRIYEAITSEIRANSREQVDQEWRDFISSAKRNLGMKDSDFSASGKSLSEVLYQLLKDRKALMKKKESSNASLKSGY